MYQWFNILCIIFAQSEMVLEPIKNDIVLHRQIIKHMNHKMFLGGIAIKFPLSIWSPLKFKIDVSRSFSINFNLQSWNSIKMRSHTYSSACLKQPSNSLLENLHLLHFVPVQILTFKQSNWHWWAKWSIHWLIYLTQLMLWSFSQGLYHPWEHSCSLFMQELNSFLTRIHYFPVILYFCAFNAKGIFQTSFLNQPSYTRIQ